MFGYVWGIGSWRILLKLLPRKENVPILLRWLVMPCMNPGDAVVKCCLFCGGVPLHGNRVLVRVLLGVDGAFLF